MWPCWELALPRTASNVVELSRAFSVATSAGGSQNARGLGVSKGDSLGRKLSVAGLHVTSMVVLVGRFMVEITVVGPAVVVVLATTAVRVPVVPVPVQSSSMVLRLTSAVDSTFPGSAVVIRPPLGAPRARRLRASRELRGVRGTAFWICLIPWSRQRLWIGSICRQIRNFRHYLCCYCDAPTLEVLHLRSYGSAGDRKIPEWTKLKHFFSFHSLLIPFFFQLLVSLYPLSNPDISPISVLILPDIFLIHLFMCLILNKVHFLICLLISSNFSHTFSLTLLILRLISSFLLLSIPRTYVSLLFSVYHQTDSPLLSIFLLASPTRQYQPQLPVNFQDFFLKTLKPDPERSRKKEIEIKRNTAVSRFLKYK